MSDKTIDDGGPAFPADIQRRCPQTGEWTDLPPQGMTLRQWYAGQAVAGQWRFRGNTEDSDSTTARKIAKTAFAIADAMIAHERRGGAA